jgi:hypothetical protein
MKPPVRRLGRGLGAFLDFGPAGEDGTAFVADALGGSGASVLETSAPAPVPAPPRLDPRPAPSAVSPRPSIVAPAAPPPVPSAADDAAFVDDVVEGLSFPEVDLG